MGVKYHRGKQDETAMNVGVLCAIVLNVMVEVDVPKRNKHLNLLGEASKKSNKRMTEFDFTVNIYVIRSRSTNIGWWGNFSRKLIFV